ncbi:MAG: PAS domain-containing protein, partial [Anaerolineae bacterium]|nr:PAS domain-containing protein [Anaerolineae bacterium]
MGKRVTAITHFTALSGRRGRVMFVLGCWVVYALVFSPLHRVAGLSVTALGILPVIAGAWLFGIWAGLFSGLLSLALTSLLASLSGVDAWSLFLQEGLLGFVTTVLSGVVVGWLGDLSAKLKLQMAERQRAEEALRQLNNELEQRVRERAAELVRYNEQLQREIAQRKRTEGALRKSEALLHSLVESLPQNVFSKDLEGRFTFANQRYCTTEGRSLDDVLGKTDFDLHPPELAKKYREDDRRVMETEQIFETVEEHQPVGGEKFYVQVIKAPLYDDTGQITGILGVFWDITEQKRIEEALKTYATRLERSNKELHDFVYAASHDLQEPLRKIRTFGDRLQSRYGAVLDERGRDYLARMQSAAARMQALIDGLLVYSRVTTKAQPFVQVDLNRVLHEVLSDLEVRIEQLQARVEVGELPTVEA